MVCRSKKNIYFVHLRAIVMACVVLEPFVYFDRQRCRCHLRCYSHCYSYDMPIFVIGFVECGRTLPRSYACHLQRLHHLQNWVLSILLQKNNENKGNLQTSFSFLLVVVKNAINNFWLYNFLWFFCVVGILSKLQTRIIFHWICPQLVNCLKRFLSQTFYRKITANYHSKNCCVHVSNLRK